MHPLIQLVAGIFWSMTVFAVAVGLVKYLITFRWRAGETIVFGNLSTERLSIVQRIAMSMLYGLAAYVFISMDMGRPAGWRTAVAIVLGPIPMAMVLPMWGAFLLKPVRLIRLGHFIGYMWAIVPARRLTYEICRALWLA